MTTQPGSIHSDLVILNTSEGAKLIRMSEAKLRELASSGSIRAYRVGPRWRFRREDLLDWVCRQANANVAPEVADIDSLEG